MALSVEGRARQLRLVVDSFENAELIEDEDGQRVLVCPLEVPVYVWFTSAPQGAVMLVCPEYDYWWACSADEFIEKRTQDLAHKVYVAPKLHRFTFMPTWREYRAALKAEEAARPGTTS
jgi:hypothetical protein